MESHEKVNNKPITFMCYMGLERSQAIRNVYEDVGKKADVFPGGIRRLCRMDVRNIRKELGGKFVYLIYDQSSKGVEYVAKSRAEDLLKLSKVEYQVIDSMVLRIMAYGLGRNLDDFLI